MIFWKDFLGEIRISVCLSHLSEELVRDWCKPQLPHQPLDMATEQKGGAKMVQKLSSNFFAIHLATIYSMIFFSPNVTKKNKSEL